MKKGFTLIELLAVIVILAIIALIATPIVLNIIKDSRESAGLRSAEMYLDAVEQSISVEKMNNTKFNPNTCTITEQGNLDCDTKDGILEVKVNGDKPLNGKITFENGKIKDVSLEYSNNKLIVKNEESKLVYKNYISINNYQHKHTDGTIEDHEVTFDSNGHGTCSKCMEEVLAAGLYAEDGTMTYSWDELIENTGLIVTNGNLSSGAINPTSPDSSLTALSGKLIISDNISSIGMNTFTGCASFTEIVIPESVTSIGSGAFVNCTGLTKIAIPESVTTIEFLTFQSCKGLTSVDLGNGVTSIGQNAFGGCTSLKTIEIPDSVTSIGNYAFIGCTGLKTIEIPDGVICISEGAFDGCTGLTSITIPDSVTSIEKHAFSRCTGLTSIAIPNSVTSIASSIAFYDCTNLTTIYYSGTAEDVNGNNWGATNATIKPYSEAPKELLP